MGSLLRYVDLEARVGLMNAFEGQKYLNVGATEEDKWDAEGSGAKGSKTAFLGYILGNEKYELLQLIIK